MFLGYGRVQKLKIIVIQEIIKMEEIVKAVSEKTGLSEAQAQQAAEAVVNVLKDKLPAPIASQLDGLISGDGGGLGSLSKGLGGLLG
jgi:hypothetical protein